jgi:hypothetical protein
MHVVAATSHGRGTSLLAGSPTDRLMALLLGVEGCVRWGEVQARTSRGATSEAGRARTEDVDDEVARDRIRWAHRRRAQRRLRRLPARRW